MGVSNTIAFIQTDWGGAQYQWSFLANGVMTAPGAISAVGNIIGGNIVTSGSGGDITLTSGNITGVNNISTGTITLGNGAVLKDNAGNAVSFGQEAGLTSQGTYAVAVGAQAGQTTQGSSAIAIGYGTGAYQQGNNAVAIGWAAATQYQGNNAVAIGAYAGESNQGNNSIIINATGATLDQTTANTFTVAPIRNAGGTSGLLQYNSTTKEVTYSSDITSNSNINIEINLADSTRRVWQFGEDGALTFPDGTNQSTAFTGIPGPYADDEAAALAGVALGSPYHKTGTNGQVFVRLTSPT
jgi:hypothetical protein